MAESNPQLIDDAQMFGFVGHPVRCRAAGIAVVLEALFKFFMLPQLVAGPVLMVAVLAAIWLPEAYRTAFVISLWLSATFFGVYAFRSHKTESAYDKESGQFRMRRWLLGRTLRSHVWDRSIFKGISNGDLGGSEAQCRVIRVHALADGFLVDQFMSADYINTAYKRILKSKVKYQFVIDITRY